MWVWTLKYNLCEDFDVKISMRLVTKTKNTRKHLPRSVPMTSYFCAKKELMISFWAPPQSICSTKKLSGQLSNQMMDCPQTNTYLLTNSFLTTTTNNFLHLYQRSIEHRVCWRKPKIILNLINSW